MKASPHHSFLRCRSRHNPILVDEGKRLVEQTSSHTAHRKVNSLNSPARFFIGDCLLSLHHLAVISPLLEKEIETPLEVLPLVLTGLQIRHYSLPIVAAVQIWLVPIETRLLSTCLPC